MIDWLALSVYVPITRHVSRPGFLVGIRVPFTRSRTIRLNILVVSFIFARLVRFYTICS